MGPKSPKTPISASVALPMALYKYVLWLWLWLWFWGPELVFKPNMRKIQIAISSDLCIRLTWNLTGSCGWSRMVVKQFQDGGRPPFWKTLYRHISAKNHPISMKFCNCTQQQILNWMNVTWSKMKKLHWTDSVFDRTYVFLKQASKHLYLPDQ